MITQKQLENYAELAVKVGVNLQKGQELVVSIPVECAEFARMVTKSAYEAGAKRVWIKWADDAITRMNMQYQELSELQDIKPFVVEQAHYEVDNRVAFLFVSAADPELYAGLDANKVKAAQMARIKALKFSGDSRSSNLCRWTIVSLPTVVFIGPCVAKKDEAEAYSGYADAVLTYEDLALWLKEAKISLVPDMDDTEESRARFFPTTGGILKTMAKDPEYTYMAIEGMENCIAALKDIESKRIHRCFIEMSACIGSCVGGPVMEKFHRSPVRDYAAVSRYAGEKDFRVDQPSADDVRKTFKVIDTRADYPTEAEITEILKKMGKTRHEDELNCGSCGYNTCREKAVAIYQGKAEISMCLPYLKEKAESFSDCIVNNTPNGLIVLNENLEVQQINAAARKILNIRSASDVLGDGVVRILDTEIFTRVLNSRRSVRNERTYLAEYKKYVEQTVVYDGTYHLLVCIMRDITDEENEREKKESISHQTVEVADKVVEKQMRIVQEIASLLGETAAETKIALTKLKESISDE